MYLCKTFLAITFSSNWDFCKILFVTFQSINTNVFEKSNVYLTFNMIFPLKLNIH